MVWLKLDKNFFKRPEIEEIKSKQGGKDMIILYCLLLLAFGEKIPCDPKKLSDATGVQEDRIKDTVNEFYKLGLAKKVKPDDSKPTFEEVEEYANELGSKIDVKKFYDWYAADDFLYKGKPMDWKAKLRQWTVKERPVKTANPFLVMMKEHVIEYS